MSTIPANRLLVFSGLAALTAAWFYAATLEWRGELLTRDIVTHRSPATAYDTVPLSPAPARAAAQRLLAEDSPDYARADELLAYSLALRPIYGPYWLDRAEAAYQSGHIPAAESYLATATSLWPTRPALLWKAAMLHARIGNADQALAMLGRYIRSEPNGYRAAVAVASRLEENPTRMLTSILPGAGSMPGRVSRDELAWRILRDARVANNTALGRVAWNELTTESRQDPDIARYYVEWMVAAEQPDEAIAAWSAYRGLDPLPPVENGGFEEQPRGGLDWRVNDRGPVRIERDADAVYADRYSLKLTFPGNENLSFHHVRQFLPVEPGADYILHFAWRGEAISTRSGPYIEVRAAEEGRLAAGESRWGTWDWQRETIQFTVPDAVRFVEVWVRRNPTNALDNEIGGVLWLDQFGLAAAGED